MLRKLFLPLLLAASVLPGVAQSATTQTRPLGVTVRRASAAVTQAAAGTNSPYTTFVFNWTYTPNLPACTTVNIACYDGFVFTNTDTHAVIANQGQVPSSVLSYNYNPVGGIPFGTYHFSEVAHGYDETGAEVVSTVPATVSVAVHVTTLNGPTGLQAKAQ